MRDSESESTTIKMAGGCAVAVIWVVALPFIVIECGAECSNRQTVATFIAVMASILVVFAARFFARKSDGE